MIRSSLPPRDIVAAMRAVMSGIDPDVPAYSVRTMEEVIAAASAGPRFRTILLVVFAATALFLATIGIYGVISYSVEQRTREIGIRIATGASRRHVLQLIMGRVARVAGIGIAIGCLAAIALSRVLESLLFEVDAADPRVFTIVVGLLFITAMLASAMPAHRAASVDPARCLRYD